MSDLGDFLRARLVEDREDSDNHEGLALRSRLRRDVEAKLLVLDIHEANARSAGLFGTDDEDRSSQTLQALATVYAAHPEYRDEWRI